MQAAIMRSRDLSCHHVSRDWKRTWSSWASPSPPVSQTPPDLSDGRAAWWGRVYVLEGSRQGSALIARCIHSSLGDTVPCRFFGETIVPDDFGRLLATLERELEVEDALAQAVAGAREAFADYKAELDAFDSRKRAVEMR